MEHLNEGTARAAVETPLAPFHDGLMFSQAAADCKRESLFGVVLGGTEGMKMIFHSDAQITAETLGAQSGLGPQPNETHASISATSKFLLKKQNSADLLCTEQFHTVSRQPMVGPWRTQEHVSKGYIK